MKINAYPFAVESECGLGWDAMVEYDDGTVVAVGWSDSERGALRIANRFICGR